MSTDSGCRGLNFAYDPAKSAVNRDKHGIDFVAAQALWADPQLVEIAARTQDEPRFLVTGMIGAQHWTAVVTYRGGSVRIISVRRARQREIEAYESD